ncbi:MAG: TraR/DksA C4-type zinc finger protein [Patescibacteria group bacterium]|jgi:RNA polymerase-binding transcription factor DksA
MTSELPKHVPTSKAAKTSFLQQVRQRLMKEYDAVTKRLSTLMDKGKSMWEEYGNKDEENAAEVSEFQDTLSMEKNLEKSKADLEAALQQVDAGTYGKCHTCGKAIESERLKLAPAATLCTSCVLKAREQK